jgi:hypothetical protein
MVWPITAVVENDEVEITSELVVNEYDVQASEIIIGAIVTKFEVDNETLALMLMAWLVLAIVDNVEVEVIDEPIVEVSMQHFVVGLNIAIWVLLLWFLLFNR